MKNSSVLEKIKAYIRTRNIEQLSRLTVKSFADRFQLNYSYLSRAFRAWEHMTLNEFLLREKMKRCAAYLLENQDKSVREVSELIGFAESRYFIKVFHRYIGTSPGKYRKMNRKNHTRSSAGSVI